MLDKIWDFISNSQTLYSFLAMLFAGYIAVQTWFQNKSIIKLAKQVTKSQDFQGCIKSYNGIQTERPVALALSLIENAQSIKKDIETFLKYSNMKMQIEEITMQGINSQEDIEKFINLLREKRYNIDLKDFTEVHLFIQGPVMAGVLAGAMFDHWKPIKLYHKPRLSPPQIYEYWCPLIK